MKRTMKGTWRCASIAGAFMLCSLSLRVAAQDLPPELTGDYTNLPPPPPPKPAPAPPRPSPAPSRPAPAPELDEPPFDPELGDIGPVGPSEPIELQDDAQPIEGEMATETETGFGSEPALDEEPTSVPQRTRFFLGFGLGVGTLEFARPAAGGVQRLSTTPFAALDIDVRAHLWHANDLSLELLLSYNTSLGLVLESDPLFALPEDVPVRAQHIEISAAPRLRINGWLALALPVGVSVQLFTPKVHQYPVEPYAIIGLMMRPEAIVTLADQVTLRAGPEVQWLGWFNAALENEGVCCSGGAIGAQATLQTELGRVVSLALSYRELRSVVPVAARFTNTERVVTARLVGEL